jgi:hypothetical protein
MAWQSLEQGNDPYDLIGLGGCFGNSVQTTKAQEYVELLERIIIRSFDGLAQSPKLPSPHPFGFGLTLAVIALRRDAPERCATVLGSLKDPTGQQADQRRLIMDYVEQRIADAVQKRTRKRYGED